MSEYIERDKLEDFAMNCVGGMVTMKQIHDFPAADKIMELITLKALADAKIERLEARLEQTRWIPVAERLPPPARCEQYLVYVRSGGGPYGDYEYNIDFAWWGEHWDQNGHGYDWNCICCDWDGDVTITHWMPLPEPPEEVEP